jgi:hypothetical protein
MEWSAERRAQWFYHNQHVIERDAYERGMRDAHVAEEVAKLKAQGVKPNPDYVDPEFKNDPSAMYTQEYVEAAYNPPMAQTNWQVVVIMIWIVVGVIGAYALYYLVFKIRWGK